MDVNLELARVALRDRFGELLVKWGDLDERLVVLDADLSGSTRTNKFQKEYPARFFNFGISEQNMMGAALGLAASGKIPVVSGFTCFTVPRGWELMKFASMEHLPVKVCTTHAGLDPGKDGATHQALEDISLVASIAGAEIYTPADPLELELVFKDMFSHKGLSYVRLMRNKLPRLWENEEDAAPLKSFGGKPLRSKLIYPIGEYIYDNPKAVIFSMGSMSTYMPALVSRLMEEYPGLEINAFHFGKIKPLYIEDLALLSGGADVLITLEEHNIYIGFGAIVARLLGNISNRPKIFAVGIDDMFGQTGTRDELLKHYKLDIEGMTAKISSVIARSNT